MSSFGFERIRLQLADGREKRFGLGQVEAGEAKVWPTRGLLAVGHGTNGARSNWSQAPPQEQVQVLAPPPPPTTPLHFLPPSPPRRVRLAAV